MAAGPVVDRWERGDAYEAYIGRWSRRVAPLFLAWIEAPAGLRWLDVGCGTGALSGAVLGEAAPGQVVGAEPSRGFLRAARDHLDGRAGLVQARGGELPFRPDSFDVVVSGLVLNFVPDARAALLDMRRVTRPGGMVAAYVWDYGGRMDLTRLFWAAAAELDPPAAQMDQAARFPLCRPEALRELFAGAGLGGVQVTALDITASFDSFEDYWRPFLSGQGPCPSYLMSLEEPARERLRAALQRRVQPLAGEPFALHVRAWAVRGGRE